MEQEEATITPGFDSETLVAMPVEVLANIFDNLTFDEVANYCESDPRVKAKCANYDLLGRASRKYIAQHAPIAGTVKSDYDHALLIERGYVSTYYYDPDSGEVEFGLSECDDAFLFSVPGLPASAGTQVYLFGDKQSYNPHSPGIGIVYSSPENLRRDVMSNLQDPHFKVHYIVAGFVEMEEDTTLSSLDTLIKTGSYVDYVFFLITLP